MHWFIIRFDLHNLNEGQASPVNRPLLPLVQAIILCDRVYKDDETRKCVLAGTFNQIPLVDFPCEYQPASLYLNLSDFSGQHTVSFRFKRLNDDSIIEESPEFPLEHGDRREHHECIFELPPMVFSEPGRYTWEVVFDRTEVIGTADVEAVMLVPSNDYEELSEGPQEEQG